MRFEGATLGKIPDKADFRAPMVLFDNDDQRFAQRLMGFVVAGQLDQHPMSRRWWAAHLDVAPSTITKMTEEPSGALVAKLDLALLAQRSDQRLLPRLSDLYTDIQPSNARDKGLLEWLARQPVSVEELPTRRPRVAEQLLRSELALKRCEVFYESGDIDVDPIVEEALRRLLVLASGPYGASNVAHHQCAQLGAEVPDLFFRLLEQHFDRSPVAFRLLRTLDRFVNVWASRESDPRSMRQGRERVDRSLSSLLNRLGHAAQHGRIVDPYPGSEWAITLVRDFLRLHPDSDTATEWLANACCDERASARERSYAAFTIAARSATASAPSAALDSLRQSSSSVLRRWADLLDGTDLQRLPPIDRQSAMEQPFQVEKEIVSSAIASTWPAALDGIRSSMHQLVFASLVTADGRLRRNLIEAVVAAGLVTPSVPVLRRIWDTCDDNSVREAVIFFLSRLREPSEHLIELFMEAAQDDDRAVSHAAVWGLGDLFKPGQEHAYQAPVKLLDDIVSNGSMASISDAKIRIAAAHARAIIEKDWQGDLPHNMRPIENGVASPLEQSVRALSKWGQLLAARKSTEDPFIDPTALGLTGLLELDRTK